MYSGSESIMDENMATSEQPAYRKAIGEARARARASAAARRRERRRRFSILAGSGLSFFLLGAGSVFGSTVQLTLPILVVALCFNGAGIGGQQVEPPFLQTMPLTR